MMARVERIAFVALTAVLAACAAKAVPGTGGTHPAGAALVVGVRAEGGLLAPGARAREVGLFTLVGDGRAITPGAEDEIYPGRLLPNVTQRDVSEDGIQTLLNDAREAALTEGDRTVGLPPGVGIADAGEMVFTVSVDGKTSVTRVEALGVQQESGERAKIQAFRDELGDLEHHLPSGSVSTERSYDIPGLRVVVSDYRPPEDNLRQEPKAWPLATPLASFGAVVAWDPGSRCGAVTGDDLARLLPPVREANMLTPWTSGGKRYGLALRPMLPYETAC